MQRSREEALAMFKWAIYIIWILLGVWGAASYDIDPILLFFYFPGGLIALTLSSLGGGRGGGPPFRGSGLDMW